MSNLLEFDDRLLIESSRPGDEKIEREAKTP